MENQANSTAAAVNEEVQSPSEEQEVVENDGSEETGDESPDTSDASEPKEVASKSEKSNKSKSQAKKAEQKARELKKLKIKFNGQEEDLEFDPNDDEFLAKQFQLAKLGHTKAQEYSQLEKGVNELLETLRTNPRAILADPTIGVDLKKLAAEIIDEEISNSKKSPEQIEKERLEKELKTLKEEQKRKEDEFKQREFERMQELAYQSYDQQIHSALEKADIPKNPYTIKKIADYMMLGLQNGLDVEAQDVLPLVREEIQNDLKQMFGVMPDEMIEQLVGKDVIGRIRKKSVSKAKQAPVPLNKALKDVGKKAEPKKEEKKISYKDFFKGV